MKPDWECGTGDGFEAAGAFVVVYGCMYRNDTL